VVDLVCPSAGNRRNEAHSRSITLCTRVPQKKQGKKQNASTHSYIVCGVIYLAGTQQLALSTSLATSAVQRSQILWPLLRAARGPNDRAAAQPQPPH
jgi:hypothetical protein